jgi:MFS family permease
VLFTAASLTCALATSPLFLNLARGAQGVGGAIMFATSLALIAQEFQGRQRGTASGIWDATVGFAVAAGPLSAAHTRSSSAGSGSSTSIFRSERSRCS